MGKATAREIREPYDMVEPRLTRIYYNLQLSPVIFPEVISPYPSQKIDTFENSLRIPCKSKQRQFQKVFSKNGQCAQKKNSFFPLLAQSRSWNAFFFFSPYTLSKKTCMEGRRKKASHSCAGPGVGRGKCIFSGCIFCVLHKMVYLRRESYRTLH